MSPRKSFKSSKKSEISAAPVSKKQAVRQNKQQYSLLYGTHAVDAALNNPNRILKNLYVTPNRQQDYEGYSNQVKIQTLTKEELDKLLPTNSTHQGVALSAILKETSSKKDFTETEKPVIILDGLTDPQNIGAILRTSAAFGVEHVILQEKGSPEVTGALAKAAAGAVEHLQIHKVTNLVRAIETLQKSDFLVYGADGYSEHTLNDIKFPHKTVLIVGSEGNGMRKLVKSNCDMTFKIPMHDAVESLNVASAFAITLYAATLA